MVSQDFRKLGPTIPFARSVLHTALINKVGTNPKALGHSAPLKESPAKLLHLHPEGTAQKGLNRNHPWYQPQWNLACPCKYLSCKECYLAPDGNHSHLMIPGKNRKGKIGKPQTSFLPQLLTLSEALPMGQPSTGTETPKVTDRLPRCLKNPLSYDRGHLFYVEIACWVYNLHSLYYTWLITSIYPLFLIYREGGALRF